MLRSDGLCSDYTSVHAPVQVLRGYRRDGPGTVSGIWFCGIMSLTDTDKRREKLWQKQH